MFVARSTVARRRRNQQHAESRRQATRQSLPTPTARGGTNTAGPAHQGATTSAHTARKATADDTGASDTASATAAGKEAPSNADRTRAFQPAPSQTDRTRAALQTSLDDARVAAIEAAATHDADRTAADRTAADRASRAGDAAARNAERAAAVHTSRDADRAAAERTAAVQAAGAAREAREGTNDREARKSGDAHAASRDRRGGAAPARRDRTGSAARSRNNGGRRRKSVVARSPANLDAIEPGLSHLP